MDFQHYHGVETEFPCIFNSFHKAKGNSIPRRFEIFAVFFFAVSFFIRKEPPGHLFNLKSTSVLTLSNWVRLWWKKKYTEGGNKKISELRQKLHVEDYFVFWEKQFVRTSKLIGSLFFLSNGKFGWKKKTTDVNENRTRLKGVAFYFHIEQWFIRFRWKYDENFIKKFSFFQWY